jgi:hypothetical protein
MAPPHPSNDPHAFLAFADARAVAEQLGPLAARSILLGRDDNQPAGGVIPAGTINNKVFFALFGVIGAGFVVTGIWFFFWAKNGGFYFKQDDWDDYKTTVLRRRGPNGTLLSGATPSTNLGGGSIYKDVDDGATDDTRTTMTGITAGASDIAGREKRRRKKEQREREKERRREERQAARAGKKTAAAADDDDDATTTASPSAATKLHKSSTPRKVGADGVLIDEEAEAAAQEQLRSYRHEKAARVGGLNKEREGSNWDGSTNPSGSDITEELLHNRERTPTSTPTKSPTKSRATGGGGAAAGGIRKVYSTADRNAERESERIRAEARKLQEKGRAAASSASSGGGGGGRRDFSWRQNDEATSSHVPGSWTESDAGGSDLGTKVYRHSLTSGDDGTATRDFAYAEEKRRKRREREGGYRRGRDDGLTEDGH